MTSGQSEVGIGSQQFEGGNVSRQSEGGNRSEQSEAGNGSGQCETEAVNTAPQQKIFVLFDDDGRPVRDKAAEYSSNLGEYSRAHASITHHRWKDVSDDDKKLIWKRISDEYDLSGTTKEKVMAKANEYWRKYKSSTLRKVYGKEAVVAQQRSGRKGLARIAHELKEKNPNTPVTRTHVYVALHTTSDGTCPTQEHSDKMVRIKEIAANTPSSTMLDMDHDPVAQKDITSALTGEVHDLKLVVGELQKDVAMMKFGQGSNAVFSPGSSSSQLKILELVEFSCVLYWFGSSHSFSLEIIVPLSKIHMEMFCISTQQPDGTEGEESVAVCHQPILATILTNPTISMPPPPDYLLLSQLLPPPSTVSSMILATKLIVTKSSPFRT
ncbi:hypothetical protein IFM89_023398 [Coptis chinensis]|uniref:Uncharacterized protein n=1 Tax=Coptis chinensis TaxID=261450 RepID=A0A835IZG5_9MAGN|nr:hypothetical protein IFM89_023398 [Coptis chinensis]